MIEKRAEAGDPAGISNLANQYLRGGMGVKQDVPRAAELYERAAELGNKDSHNTLSCIYAVGMMDVKKDMAKAIRHWEKAAMLGHAVCRHNLGSQEYAYGNRDLALQHLMISAKLGYETSLNMIKMMFMNGAATKADYAGALRGYQNAIEEMRSPDRDEAIKGLASNMPKLSWEL
ncbi:hypothetical protein THAOC_34107 [Thalassiosira oceanica]|uniref:Sel1 repeat family protein n=1 Tax=Thalassiosira oceanica TaxID=159749 RepID=K0RDV6_THAOC|nr:hypothetical protein THAOC_34107 [Thalassiosira oceanica]|eukprot:EJK47191.1 hypothetical protein THAOC_34107 [Thalassiosira oceanica]